METAEADTQASGLRRDAILEAVAFAAEQLLLSPDWRDVADGVLARLGISADVSRAYIMRNVVIDARDCVEQLTEWCAPGISSQFENPSLTGRPWEDNGLERWAELLRSGAQIQSLVEDLPLRERDELQSQDILSIVVFPVTVDGQWWGLVGFDDCAEAREWSGAELDALRAAATVLGAAIQRRRAEELASANESRYQAFVEQIPAVTYTDVLIDGRAHVDYISPQVESLLGYARQEFRDDPDFWFSIIHPDDRERVEGAASQENNGFDAEYRMVAADGRAVWVHDISTALIDDRGETIAWQGFLVDITARRSAEEQLREAELRFRTIVEQSQAVFYTQDIDPRDPTLSNTTYIAPGNTELVGYTLEDIQRDPGLWRKIIHPEDRERVLAADAIRNTGVDDHFSMEFRMIRKDGRTVWVQDEAAMVRLPGKAPYWQGFMLDVTERKLVEEQLAGALDVERDAAQRLRSVDEMKNTFLQAVSHDLRTPLAAILGLAITLERGDIHLAEDDARDLAGRIAENARKLERLVTNLLDMDRLARGIVTPKLVSTDVGELVERVVAESDMIEPSRLTVDTHPVTIQAEAAKIERIVENLLANTARHTPTNAHVWVTVRKFEDGAILMVEDSGVGVPPELREAIFEPFRQGPEAPQHSPGVGVGLTLVRRFAELHGGRAWIEERDGGGASFRVFLPAGGPALEATA